MKKIKSLISFIDITFVVLISGFLLYIFVDIFNISKTLKEMQKDKIALAIKNEKETLTTLLKYNFTDELKNEIKKIISHSKDIKNIEINLSNRVFRFNSYESENKMSFKIKEGEIVVYYENNLIKRFFEKYFVRFLIYFLIFFPIIFLLFWYIRTKILKLNLLAKRLEKINFKKISSIEKVDAFYEIENITKAVNTLLKQVNLFYKNQKEFLHRIVKYKNQLETAQSISEMFSWDYDCKEKRFSIMGKNIKILNLKKIKTLDDFLSHFEEEDKKAFKKKLKSACLNNESFEMIHTFITDENKKFYFKSVGKFIKGKVIGVSLNVTEEIKRQQKIEFLAYHDPLTSLPNRAYLKEEFSRLLNIAKRNNKKIAVLYLDLDNFKMVNDTLGHENGDKLLITIANRLKSVLRKSDFISRIGGDEFIILLYGIKDKNSIKEVINKIVNSLKEPINIKQTPIYPTFSIGCAVYPDDSTNMDELLKFADIAMYEAKNKGKNSSKFINEELKKQVNEYYNITNELKSALEKEDELILFFQPQIDLKHKKVRGAEALIRWNHPKRGLLSPFHFISYAEKSNLITYIDRYVLKKAFETLKKWQKYFPDLILSINISPNEFRQSDFISNLKNMLNIYKINPNRLELEITETISMQDIAYTVNILEEVKALGFKIAIDDFGTGYSSLNYLKKLPFNTLKIDQTFIKDLEKDVDDLIITEMIVQIAKVLKKETVAEGVENKKILEIIKNLEVDVAQGYYFAKPMPKESFERFVRNFDYNKFE